MGRVQDKVALVFGAGSVGAGWGNGNAAAVAYAREGAKMEKQRSGAIVNISSLASIRCGAYPYISYVAAMRTR